jgi:hypothetical protein
VGRTRVVAFVCDLPDPLSRTVADFPSLRLAAELDRRLVATLLGAAFEAEDLVERALDALTFAALGFDVLTKAFTSWSLRMECQPESPLRLASSARSFRVCVFREAVVIKGCTSAGTDGAEAFFFYAARRMMVCSVVRDERFS